MPPVTFLHTHQGTLDALRHEECGSTGLEHIYLIYIRKSLHLCPQLDTITDPQRMTSIHNSPPGRRELFPLSWGVPVHLIHTRRVAGQNYKSNLCGMSMMKYRTRCVDQLNNGLSE